VNTSYQKSAAYQAQMTNFEFKRLGSFIQKNYGIKLPPQKRMMVQGRLHKRLIANDMDSFSDYLEYVFSDKGMEVELPAMVDLISTNKTDFFREPSHFNTLTDLVLQEYVKSHSFSNFKVWSAGCSSGEEVYTLAMVINEFFESHKGYLFQILGTDISHQMLENSRKAIYRFKDVATMPLYLKRKYLLKSKNRELQQVRIVPDLRAKCKFQHLNFMDATYEMADSFDVVFCRNVIIYFEADVQEKVLSKILSHVKPGGYLFLGHSESINDMNLPVKKILPTVFQKI
jgi:chemotaxis protein methyltransferase CheR